MAASSVTSEEAEEGLRRGHGYTTQSWTYVRSTGVAIGNAGDATASPALKKKKNVHDFLQCSQSNVSSRSCTVKHYLGSISVLNSLSPRNTLFFLSLICEEHLATAQSTLDTHQMRSFAFVMTAVNSWLAKQSFFCGLFNFSLHTLMSLSHF